MTTKSNTYLLPNVIVRRVSECRDGNESVVYDSYNPKAHKDRLSYFQLIGLRNVAPLLYSSAFFQRENLTPLQTAQMEAYLQSGSSLLWPELDDLQQRFMPMSGKAEENPFELDGHDPVETSVETSVEADAGKTNTEIEVLPQPDAPGEEISKTIDGQEVFLTASLDSSLLVMAPPGTGKTHILIERLCDVIRSIRSGSANDTVLVLSFTRSAVSVIINRVLGKIEAGADDDLRYLNIRTFDSYATYSLLADHDYDSLVSKDYDARIQMFNRLLSSESESFEEAMEEIDKVRYLFVDEIQDLVGDRAQMVLLLAERVINNGGFVTVLGDPAQAIYDYLVRLKKKPPDSREFLADLRRILSLAENSQAIRLTKYWRYTNDRLRAFIEEACSSLGGDGSEPDGGRLSSLVTGLDYIEFNDIFSVIEQERPTVILTRQNAEMHQIARWCAINDLPYRVIDQARQHWPPWLAQLLGGFEQDEMSRGKAGQRWAQKVGEGYMEFDAAWNFLVAEGMADDTHVDLVTANEIVRQRSPSEGDSGDAGEHDCLTISTIHKSKGREYDKVLLLDPDRNWAGYPEEIRNIYVAATRAKESLAMLRRNKAILKYVQHRDSVSRQRLAHSLVRISNSLSMLVVKGIEDLDLGSMITGDRERNAFLNMQKSLWCSYLENTLALRLRMRSATQGRGILFLMGEPPHAIIEICKLRTSLSTDMWRADPQKTSRNTVTLKGFTSVDLCTYAFDLDSRRVKDRFGASGLGLVPMISGLGEIIYE